MSAVTPITPQDMTRPRLEDGYVRIINSLIKSHWDDQHKQAVLRMDVILGRAVALGEMSIFREDQVKPFYEAVGGWDVRYFIGEPEIFTSWVFSVPE